MGEPSAEVLMALHWFFVFFIAKIKVFRSYPKGFAVRKWIFFDT
jgi:hypothetical protein